MEALINQDGLFGPYFQALINTMKSATQEVENIWRHMGWFRHSSRLCHTPAQGP